LRAHGGFAVGFFVAKQSAPGELPSGSISWRIIGGWALIFCATFLAYLPALNGGFLWDDDAHVTKPGLQSLDGLRRIWFEVGASQQYYPLLHSAFWVEHRLWGEATIGYHLTNLLMHATAACLVVAIVRRLFNPNAIAPTVPAAEKRLRSGRSTGSEKSSAAQKTAASALGETGRYAGVEWLAGFVFALHPVCVESVAWISEQKNTLSAVFYLSSALLYLHFDQSRRKSQYGLALGLFALALLSKTVTATLPAALLVVFWWQRGRLDWRRDVLPLLPWFLLGLAGGLLTAWVEHRFFISVYTGTGATGTDFSLSFFERCLLAGRVIWFYLGKLLWPADLMFMYPQWKVDSGVWWQYLFPLGIGVLIAGLARVARKHRGPLAGFLFFAGTLFPALGFINVYPFIFSYVADHFQYLASLGIIVPLAAGLLATLRSLPGRGPSATRWLAPASGGLLLAVLGVLTWRQCGMYRDAETLYQETLRRNPDCWMAHSNLGLIQAKTADGLPEALEHFAAAVRLKPENAELHNYLGSALARTPGRQSEALAEFETALRLSPKFPYAHINLGVALMGAGRLPEALEHFEAAVRLKPDLAEAHNFLGYALARFPGREAEAIAEFETALRINPDFHEAHTNLGIALAEIPGRMPEAIGHFEAAVRIDPGSASAHYNLGYALVRMQDRQQDALAQFEAVLRIDPNQAAARRWVERLRAAQP
jgi:protein O-mannosyl-transferase